MFITLTPGFPGTTEAPLGVVVDEAQTTTTTAAAAAASTIASATSRTKAGSDDVDADSGDAVTSTDSTDQVSIS